MKISRRIRQCERELVKRKRPRLADACLRALELPEDTVGGEARMVLCGSGTALVENIEGVSELSRDRLRLRLKSGEITISGEDLAIEELRPDALRVTGRIRAVALDGGAA